MSRPKEALKPGVQPVTPEAATPAALARAALESSVNYRDRLANEEVQSLSPVPMDPNNPQRPLEKPRSGAGGTRLPEAHSPAELASLVPYGGTRTDNVDRTVKNPPRLNREDH